MTRLDEARSGPEYKEGPPSTVNTTLPTQKIADAALTIAALKDEATATKMGLPYLVGKAFFLGVVVGLGIGLVILYVVTR